MYKYYDFIFENLISESVIVYSRKFKDILKNITDSPVSSALQKIENNDITVLSNYIDISDNKDTFSFIPDRKAKEILGDKKEKYIIYNGDGGILTHSSSNKDIYERLGYDIGDREHAYRPESGEKALFISKTTSTTSGKVYLYLKFDNGECVCNEEFVTYLDNSKDVWTKYRQSVRVGRGVKTLLKASGITDIKESDIELFVNKYKSEFDKLSDVFRNFELVQGQDIGMYYNNIHYLRSSKGSLSQSCMAGSPMKYFDIYMSNPEVCKLLILKTKNDDDEDKIKGRALLWTLSKPKDIIFMDRIYTHDDSDVQLFREYAKSKGWYYKPHNDSSNSYAMITPQGDKVATEDLVVLLPHGEQYSNYPYLDTLKYYNPNKKTLTTSDSKYRSSDGTILLEDTGGGHVDECSNCGGRGQVDCYECGGDTEISCWECDGDGSVECKDCDGEGEIECSNCSGDGEIECSTCDGEGNVDGEECSDCSGKGKIECSDCKGKGNTKCEECEGRGEKSCERCSGNGNYECPECYGNGTMDCPECQ